MPCHHPNSCVIFAAGVLAGCLPSVAVAELTEQPPAEQISRLIQELDDPRFAVRERADQQLIELGEVAVPALIDLDEQASAEVRFRARRIVAVVQRRLLDTAFEQLARQPDESFDLERGMWLVSRLLNPACRRADLDQRLDDLADRVRMALAGNTPPKDADPKALMAAIRQVLFVEEGFAGNEVQYQSPDNSSLEKVLETKKGLPILLSQVVIAVGRRLEVPIVGLSLPLRFMVKYDGKRAPAGFPQEDIILDPFGDGRELTVEQVMEVIRGMGGGVDPTEHFQPARPRAMLNRVFSNLVAHLQYVEKSDEAAQAEQYRRLFEELPARRDDFRR